MLTKEQKHSIDAFIKDPIAIIKDLIEKGELEDNSPIIKEVQDNLIDSVMIVYSSLFALFAKAEVVFYIEKCFEETFPNA